MDENEIQLGRSYAGKQWQGVREVIRISPPQHLGEPSLVCYLDLRTARKGYLKLPIFASNATHEVLPE